jgi:hypothetical protein
MRSAGAHECGSIYKQRDSLTLCLHSRNNDNCGQQTRKTTINADNEAVGNAAPSLMASLYAKFTFIYRECKLIFRVEDVKLPQCTQR